MNMSEDFLTLCKKRYACRNYSAEEVSKEDLVYICQCARLAPSAKNTQSWRFIIATQKDKEDVKAIDRSYGRDWATNAPAFIIVCGEPCNAWVRPADAVNHMMIDAGIVCEQICLAAADRGLGTVIICNFDPVELSHGLRLAEGVVPYAIIPIGHPASEEVPAKKRVDFEQLIARRK